MMDDYSTHSGTLFYQTKFIDRHGCSDHEKKMEAKYESNTNTNDAPVFRYAEVLLNWIEAKAVLAEMGSGTVLRQTSTNQSTCSRQTSRQGGQG